MAYGRALKHLTSYKFVGTDNSILYQYSTVEYWRTIHRFIPHSIAPNTITMTGLACMLGAVAIMLYKDRHMKGAQRWVTYTYAALLWIYSTMDCLDGMQARREGTGTSLGQLFDHGVDSVVCTFTVLCICSAIGVNDKKACIVMLCAAQNVFYWVTAKEYYAKRFDLGAIGPNELILACCTMLVVLGAIGRDRMVYYCKSHPCLLSNIVVYSSMLAMVCSTVWHIVEIYTISAFNYDGTDGIYKNACRVVPHMMFMSVQACMILCAMYVKKVRNTWNMLRYIATCTMAFSLYTILTIYSHQLSAPYIEYPVVQTCIVVAETVCMAYMCQRRMNKAMNILLGVSGANYVHHISMIIGETTAILDMSVFVAKKK